MSVFSNRSDPLTGKADIGDRDEQGDGKPDRYSGRNKFFHSTIGTAPSQTEDGDLEVGSSLPYRSTILVTLQTSNICYNKDTPFPSLSRSNGRTQISPNP